MLACTCTSSSSILPSSSSSPIMRPPCSATSTYLEKMDEWLALKIWNARKFTSSTVVVWVNASPWLVSSSSKSSCTVVGSKNFKVVLVLKRRIRLINRNDKQKPFLTFMDTSKCMFFVIIPEYLCKTLGNWSATDLALFPSSNVQHFSFKFRCWVYLQLFASILVNINHRFPIY